MIFFASFISYFVFESFLTVVEADFLFYSFTLTVYLGTVAASNVADATDDTAVDADAAAIIPAFAIAIPCAVDCNRFAFDDSNFFFLNY